MAVVLVLGIVVYAVVLHRVRPDVRAPVGFILRCCLAALPTCLLAITAARWSSPAALAVQVPIGIVFLVFGFRIMRIVGEREKKLIPIRTE